MVRHLQRIHMTTQWDIRYNFLVGGDGNAYEGGGWFDDGTTLPVCSENLIGIAFIGSFKNVVPPENQVRAAKRIIDYGVKQAYLTPDYKVIFRSDASHGANNGTKLDETIRKWPHWQNFCDSKY
ncbi:putative animal peptidoglycan recognition proteins homologous to Bacteriophage T3 lysozyme [Trypoxylus dichotomus]